MSRRWRDLLSDDVTWKNLCMRHNFRRQPSVYQTQQYAPQPVRPRTYNFDGMSEPDSAPLAGPSRSYDSTTATLAQQKQSRPPIRSHRSYFKQRYLVEQAWRTGGQHISRHITQDQGVVTSLHLTNKYIVVALDNAKIHVFDTDGGNQKTLQGHIMGVWAMVPWGDTLVSGGCDREVRVWDMSTG